MEANQIEKKTQHKLERGDQGECSLPLGGRECWKRLDQGLRVLSEIFRGRDPKLHDFFSDCQDHKG